MFKGPPSAQPRKGPFTCRFPILDRVDLLGCYSKRTSWISRLKRLVGLTVCGPYAAGRRAWATFSPLTDGQVARLVDGYRAGAAMKDLAIEFGVHRTTITQHLRRNGVSLRRRGLDHHQIDQAVRLYRQGWSLARVGTGFGVDAHTVRSALRERGVPTRGPHGRDR